MLISHGPKRSAVLQGSPERGWRAVWRFSWVLVAAGLGDTLLAFIPLRFGVPEWEFGTVASTFAALPLITMGLAGLLASALARGRRVAVLLLGWFLVALALSLFSVYIVFLSDVPIALATVQGEVRLGIIKAVVKTSWLGLVFGLTYLVGGIGALRYVRNASAR